MRARLVGGVTAAVVATAGVGAVGVSAARAGEALPGTTVAGVEVGGLDRGEVRERVAALAVERSSGALPVTAADVKAPIDRALAEVDVAATVDAALDAGSPIDRVLGRGDEVVPVVTVDEAALDARLREVAGAVDREPDPGGFTVDGTTVEPQAPQEGRRLEREAAADQVAEALRAGAPGPVALPVRTTNPPTTQAQVDAVVAQARGALAGPYVLSEGEQVLRIAPAELAPLLSSDEQLALQLDVPALTELVERKAKRFAQPATSARFAVAGAGPTVDDKDDMSWTPVPAQVSVVPGSTGRAVDVEAATARLAALVLAGDRTTPQPLPMKTVEPPLTTEAAQTARVDSLVGTFTTYFQAGQPRATNIRRIAELVDGTYVAPGEVFSLNGTAGRRTKAKGFVADGAIVDGELTDEVGGGVSQFATTIFNAAFFAGLPILEHKPHSFYISRYPAGRESTVYFGAIDVKFRNDTGNGIWVETRSTPSSVTVELYGDNGGRRVTADHGPRRARGDGGFRIAVTRTVTGGDGKGSRRVFTTSYDPVPPD